MASIEKRLHYQDLVKNCGNRAKIFAHKETSQDTNPFEKPGTLTPGHRT